MVVFLLKRVSLFNCLVKCFPAVLPLIFGEQEPGEEGEMVLIKDGECLPFPHEAHQVLAQELLHVFHANVLIVAGVGSGLSVLGGLLGGARVVALCASKTHLKFVEKNLLEWLKEKKVVPGTVLQKPPHIQQYEQKRTRPTPKPPAEPKPGQGPGQTPEPAAPGLPSPPSTASPASTQQSPAPTTGGPGKNLLSAFGSVAM